MGRTETHVPVLVVGGGTGGVAAALALARHGVRCLVTEPTDWIGGQLTSQAVPPDENAWVEGADSHRGVTRSYRAFREGVRQWYRSHRRLTPSALAQARLNPGGGWVSHLCFEPRVGHAVLQQMLGEHVASGRVEIWLEHEPIAAQADGDRVAVTFLDRRTGEHRTVEAELVLDATELGDLLALGGVEHAFGAEHRDRHGELHGHPERDDPMDQQAVSWCFAVEHQPAADHRIERPAGYERWRSWRPPLDEPWPGPWFSWTIQGHEGGARDLPMVPWPDEPPPGELELWRYRRIVDHALYDGPEDHRPPDVCLVNWVQMDYFCKPLLGVDAETQHAALREARELSRCLLYWMQTEAPRHDGGVGYPGLRLRGEELGTDDGFAKAPYIREARRLIARTIVTEAHVGEAQRRAEKAGACAAAPGGVMAEPFADSVGIGHYRLDLHPSTAMRSGNYVRAAPFRIPMGALIPERVSNVLAAGKCLGVTHVTNGCYRLHPVEWNVGEAAGVLAAYCLERGRTPAAVHDRPDDVRAVQRHLHADGVPLSWPWEEEAALR